MSKQWTVENDTGAELTVRAPNGFAVELDANSADPRERFAYFAIRQQQSDIAALTAERDQLRARLAAIDAAPTVATVCIAPTSDFPVLKYSRYDIPRINGTELIARPAKDGGT